MSVTGAGSFSFGELSGSANGGGVNSVPTGGPIPTLAEFAASVGVKADLAKAVAEAVGVTEGRGDKQVAPWGRSLGRPGGIA